MVGKAIRRKGLCARKQRKRVESKFSQFNKCDHKCARRTEKKAMCNRQISEQQRCVRKQRK
eukprot:8065048-Lingulodinium_polyedra.AAC.1